MGTTLKFCKKCGRVTEHNKYSTFENMYDITKHICTQCGTEEKQEITKANFCDDGTKR